AYQTKSGSNYNYLAAKLSYYPNDFPEYLVQISAVKVFKSPLSFANNRLIGDIGSNLLFTMGNARNYVLTKNLDTTYINDLYSFNDIFQYKNTYYSIARANVSTGYCCQT